MPDSTTQVKSPTARLHEWVEGNGFRRGTAAGDLVHEMVDAALAEAAAAERAFWEEALKRGHWRYQDLIGCDKDDLCNTKADGAELVLDDIHAFLDARNP